MSQELQKLIQAAEHFKARTRGAALPDGLDKALDGLLKAAGQPMPDRDTPGSREALKLTQGTGNGLKASAKGADAPSPGQREAQAVSAEIAKAAESIVAAQQ